MRGDLNSRPLRPEPCAFLVALLVCPPKVYPTPRVMPSKISNTITLRLRNEHIEVIELIAEMGGFASRTEAIRAMLKPSLMQFVKVMETKSILKGAKEKLKGELELKRHLELVAKNTEIQDKLELRIPGVASEYI